MDTVKEQGNLSIESKNIFSILKKWLYTEEDITFRELISNACDAISKLSKIQEDGIIEHSNFKIIVRLDTQTNSIIISDNGIGMNHEEVQKYINQIAFSGVEDFISQNDGADKDTIIGHFGVGFYSAFMLADHVAIETKSYKKNSIPVRWDCMSDMSYSMVESSKVEVGTDIIIYLDNKSPYLQEPNRIYDIIKKYFIFSSTPIYFDAPPEYNLVSVNNSHPIWKEAKDFINTVDMNIFYKEYFADVSDPLFWIQFTSLDIGVRGILFFRNTKQETEELNGNIKIYSRGVYIGENISALIPKFINLQNGIIECDNLPLVVSRGSIRENEKNENIIFLINECLSQEVTIALNEMFMNKRRMYESFWFEINAVIKYGILKDKIFASVMTKKAVFMDIYNKYWTIAEYVQMEDNKDVVFYASDKIGQAYYIEIFKKCKINALFFDHVLDQPLLYKYETLYPKLKFVRIDSDIELILKGSLKEDDRAKIEILSGKIINAIGERIGAITLKFTRLEHESISALIINDEKARRMADMMEIYGYLNATDFSEKEKQSKSSLLLNLNNKLVQFILESENFAIVNIVVNQLFDLSLMNQQSLRAEDIEKFINRSEHVLSSFITCFPPTKP